MIKKEGNKWNVYDSTGKKRLGSFTTRAAAVKQVAAVEASKADRAKKAKRKYK